MEMNEQLVSIITPLYNGERFLSATIDSVIAQTYKEWEMIIINDGSKDGGESIARAYAEKDSRIKVLSQPNRGSAAARNNGIRMATGRYIALLDADDLWEPDFLEQQLRLLKEKKCQLVCGAYKRIDEYGKEILKPFVPPISVTYNDMLYTNSIGCLTGLYDTLPYGKIYLNENFRSLRDDHIFWLDIIKKCHIAYGNQNIVASYRISSTSTTYNKRKMIVPQFRLYREAEKLSFIKSCFYLCCWALNGFLKYRKK